MTAQWVFFLHASVNTSQRVYISAIVETYLLCGVSIPFIFRRFPFATPFMCSRFLFLFGTPLMCSRTPFFLITVVLILFLCSINQNVQFFKYTTVERMNIYQANEYSIIFIHFCHANLRVWGENTYKEW